MSFAAGRDTFHAVFKAYAHRPRTARPHHRNRFPGRSACVAFPHLLPHGRAEGLDRIVVAVGVSDEGVFWPDAESRAHLVLLLGVPAAKIRDYLLLMQKILRWHKETKTLDASGRVLDVAALIEELKAVVA